MFSFFPRNLFIERKKKKKERKKKIQLGKKNTRYTCLGTVYLHVVSAYKGLDN